MMRMNPIMLRRQSKKILAGNRGSLQKEDRIERPEEGGRGWKSLLAEIAIHIRRSWRKLKRRLFP
jgi:hypothetical protein